MQRSAGMVPPNGSTESNDGAVWLQRHASILNHAASREGPRRAIRRRRHTMAIPLSEAAKKAIDANNFAHVATLMKDGSPQVSPVWIYRDGDDVMISTGVDRIKTRNLKR